MGDSHRHNKSIIYIKSALTKKAVASLSFCNSFFFVKIAAISRKMAISPPNTNLKNFVKARGNGSFSSSSCCSTSLPSFSVIPKNKGRGATFSAQSIC